MVRALVALALTLIGTLAFTTQALADHSEIWVVDQSDAANGGDRLYVYTSVPFLQGLPIGPPDVYELGAMARGVGDGAGVRPHLLLFNNAETHGVLANVASGHVYIIRASDRSIVASIDVGEQAHGAMPSPDDRWILVANQNGKRLARIQADFVNEVFTYDASADLDLGALEDANHPDNAPICPVMYVGARGKAYVTLRGGGM
jgi:DNA-binding beta-propeller fold protein YncE